MTKVAFTALATTLLATVALADQQVFRSTVQTVPIYATVLDSSGRLVPDLKQEDFDKMGNSLEAWKDAVTRSSPFDTNAYKDPYVFLGTAEQREQAFKNAAFIGKDGEHGFPNLAAAWKAGRDVAFNTDGTLRVNDASKLWKRVDDPVYSSKRFVNTRTGTFTEDVVLTAADRPLKPSRL